MNDGRICLTMSLTPEDTLKSLIAILSPLGLSLPLPGTTDVYVWNSDGTNSVVTTKQLPGILARQDSVSFQLWYSIDDDLFCTLQRRERVTMCELSLDGVDSVQEFQMWKALVDFGRNSQQSPVLALVHDKYGELPDGDWGSTDVEWLRQNVLAGVLVAAYTRNDSGNLTSVCGE